MSKYNFKLTDEQAKKYEEWKKTLPKLNAGSIGGADQFIFTPTGVGLGVSVKYFEYELDLTEYDLW